MPLIVIFCGITLAAIAAYIFSGETLFVMQVFMAGFFLVFGGLKVIKLKAFAEAYRIYDILAKRSIVYAYGYPFIEILLGLSYLFFYDPVLTNVITIVVMSIGAIGVYIKLREKEEIPCACLGTVFSLPMTWVTLFEDVLMVVMAALMLSGLV